MNIFRKWTIYFVIWLFVINRHILCHFKLNFSSAILAITEWKNRNSQHNGYQWEGGDLIAPVAETGLSHRLTSYKILGHFFGLSFRKISLNNQIENSFFFISVPCPHAHLRGLTVIKKLWTFFGPWGRDLSQSPQCWIFHIKQIHQSTASERMTRLGTYLLLLVPS